MVYQLLEIIPVFLHLHFSDSLFWKRLYQPLFIEFIALYLLALKVRLNQPPVSYPRCQNRTYYRLEHKTLRNPQYCLSDTHLHRHWPLSCPFSDFLYGICWKSLRKLLHCLDPQFMTHITLAQPFTPLYQELLPNLFSCILYYLPTHVLHNIFSHILNNFCPNICCYFLPKLVQQLFWYHKGKFVSLISVCNDFLFCLWSHFD